MVCYRCVQWMGRQGRRGARPRAGLLIGLGLVAGVAAGCASGPELGVLMPTPNLYVHAESNPFADVPEPLRTNKVELFYVTDRQPAATKDGMADYGHGRSLSMAYGDCMVEIGNNVSWDELVSASRTHTRTVPLPLTVRSTIERGRFPEAPLRLARTKDGVTEHPAEVAQQEKMTQQLRDALCKRLATAKRKEAFVFVHGSFSSFDEAAHMFAGLWHFLGREGVPIMYSWPTGYPGPLLWAYMYDRESSEFTGHHLKQFLRILASVPELEKIHLISHSRGTAVASDAVGELFVEGTAAGQDLHKTFKIGQLVLAAPDMDFEVMTQSMAEGRLFRGLDRLTVYVSEEDEAIDAATFLFASNRRLGRLRLEDITPDIQEEFEITPHTQVIDAKITMTALAHYYFMTSPAVSSDLILTLRYNRGPGAKNGRPLIKHFTNYWEIRDGYPSTPAP